MDDKEEVIFEWKEANYLLFVLLYKKHGFSQNDAFWIKHEHRTLEIMILKGLWLHCSQDVEMLRLTWITEAILSTRNFSWRLLYPSENKTISGVSFLCCSFSNALSLYRVAGNVWSDKGFRKLKWIDFLTLKSSLGITRCLQWGMYGNCIALLLITMSSFLTDDARNQSGSLWC